MVLVHPSSNLTVEETSGRSLARKKKDGGTEQRKHSTWERARSGGCDKAVGLYKYFRRCCGVLSSGRNARQVLWFKLPFPRHQDSQLMVCTRYIQLGETTRSFLWKPGLEPLPTQWATSSPTASRRARPACRRTLERYNTQTPPSIWSPRKAVLQQGFPSADKGHESWQCEVSPPHRVFGR